MNKNNFNYFSLPHFCFPPHVLGYVRMDLRIYINGYIIRFVLSLFIWVSWHSGRLLAHRLTSYGCSRSFVILFVCLTRSPINVTWTWIVSVLRVIVADEPSPRRYFSSIPMRSCPALDSFTSSNVMLSLPSTRNRRSRSRGGEIIGWVLKSGVSQLTVATLYQLSCQFFASTCELNSGSESTSHVAPLTGVTTAVTSTPVFYISLNFGLVCDSLM